MSCPYLKQVVMLCCGAYPIRKMVPLDRIATASPCLAEDFRNCPLFREAVTRPETCPFADRSASREAPAPGKEVFR